jgi:DNA-binding NtrC family response regulator
MLPDPEARFEPVNSEAGASLKRRFQNLAAAEIHSALEQAQGNRRRAAELLGISRAHLYRMMNAHGIKSR